MGTTKSFHKTCLEACIKQLEFSKDHLVMTTKITHNGFYFVRVHFYAFSPSLADAKSNVIASEHMLLSDFSPETNSTNFPIIKEFNFTINQPAKFRVYFVPNPYVIYWFNMKDTGEMLSKSIQSCQSTPSSWPMNKYTLLDNVTFNFHQ